VQGLFPLAGASSVTSLAPGAASGFSFASVEASIRPGRALLGIPFSEAPYISPNILVTRDLSSRFLKPSVSDSLRGACGLFFNAKTSDDHPSNPLLKSSLLFIRVSCLSVFVFN